jgi:hypothetical protein
VGTWPIRLATSTPQCLGMVSHTPCASRTSTGARTASGRSFTVMATRYPPTRMQPLSHRRGRHGRPPGRAALLV